MILGQLPPYQDPTRWPETFLAAFDALIVSVRGLPTPPRLPPHPGRVVFKIGGPQRLDDQDRAILEVLVARHQPLAILSLEAVPRRIRQRFPSLPRWHQVVTGQPIAPKSPYLVLRELTPHPRAVAYLLPQRYDAYLPMRHHWHSLFAGLPHVHAIVPVSTVYPEQAVLIADDLRSAELARMPAPALTPP